jgi:glutamate dehydrogenase
VRVLSPDRDRDGWHSDRSVVLIVTDDAPFLVDTVRIVLERHAVMPYLLVHPMLHVRRDAAGDLVEVLPVGSAQYGATVEAWTQVEVDRLDAVRAEELAASLSNAVASVHRVVADFASMRERMIALSEHDPLLAWLAADQFVFLGAATFDLSSGAPVCRADTALGQMRSDPSADPEITLEGPAVTVARSARIASIHRPARLTAITVRQVRRTVRRHRLPRERVRDPVGRRPGASGARPRQ